MAKINPQQQLVKDKIQEVLVLATTFCNRVLNQAKVYRFHLMDIPDPDVRTMSAILDLVIIPILEHLEEDPNILPEDGIKLVNVQQYNIHLRNIVQALKNDNQEDFETAVAALEAESLLI